jgi:hypothetical protein
MRSIRRFFIFLIVIVIALLISNPDANKHQEKIIEKYKEENPLTGSLGAGDFVKRVIAYENYYLFSFGKISINNESVSFGIAGFVIVYKSMDLMKYKDMMSR